MDEERQQHREDSGRLLDDGQQEQSALGACWAATRASVDRLIVWGNRQPVLTVRRVLAAVTGFPLALGFLASGVAMLLSLVFAPFSYQAFRLAWLALDGGITMEPYSKHLSLSLESPAWCNPAHPWTIAANLIWLLLFGWALALAQLTAAVVQALTIIGLPTALTNVQLASFALWPFGRCLRTRRLPTTLEELRQQRESESLQSSTAELLGWGGAV